MGAGLTQVGMLILLTVVGLPLFFFGLLAALDRFERTLSASPRTVTPLAPAASLPIIETDADVLTLPVTSAMTSLPVSSSVSSSAAGKPAAAI